VVESEKGKPFTISETGWGEFEITMKLYYVPESAEKPQTLYHHLRLHPYGRTDEEKEVMRTGGQVTAWVYEEQLFNEPYEHFYDILTSGATTSSASSAAGGAHKAGGGGGGKGKGKGKGKDKAAAPVRSEGGVLERSAMVPLHSRPKHPFSREAEQLEIQKLKDAQVKVEQLTTQLHDELKGKEERLSALRAELAKT
jgi:YEATS domain-containing protein 4